ncbi:protein DETOXIFICATION 45, chloroplastic-like isoform X3 [Papaver somniferum]|uniref:protein DETOXIFICATION 45, chloroplastic-like isoform X3 n=1 Tax=Papaver somniferum TaxID=3469 RepID=UPI000E70058A|nr:protein DETOXIFICATION 45, chloroplastic-like isoform X3 [Papaver somniferum]
MASTYMHGSPSNGLTSKPIKRMAAFSTPFCAVRTQRNHLTLMDKTNGIHSTNGLKKVGFSCGETMSASQAQLFSLRITPSRKTGFLVVRNQVSDSDLGNVEEKFRVQEESGDVPKSFKQGTEKLAENLISSSSNLSVTQELVGLSLPAFGGQAIDPLAQLMETAYIGSFGPLELASAGISVSIFNVISKLFNIPLLGIATSFVAEDISKAAAKESASDGSFQKESNNGRPLEVPEKKQLASVSTALLLAVGIGVFEAISLYIGSGFFLTLMGVSPASSMRIPAERFLKLRAIGAPAVVLSLALQGIFRGFKDTKTPLLCLGVGNLVAVFLFPLLMYTFGLGVIGSAIATVSSQYITTILLIWILSKKVILLPPKMENLQFGGYVKSGGFLMGRTLAVLGSVTLGTSMAARQGPLRMAAHQICFQVWLAVSLLADALASSAQAMIASSYSEGDYSRVKEITILVLKTGLFSGLALTIILGASFGKIATLFTSDAEVLAIARSGILFVCASQPLNALAFVCDGLHYGVSDFKYAAQSMMLVGSVTSAFLLYAPPIYGLPGVWMGLSLFMGLRMVAGLMRFMSKSGPWWFLHKDFQNSQNGSKSDETYELIII